MATVGEKVASFAAKFGDSQPLVTADRKTGNDYADLYGRVLTPSGGDATSFNLSVDQAGNIESIRLYSDDIDDEVRIMLASDDSLNESERQELERLNSGGEVSSLGGVVGRLIVRAALGTTLITEIEEDKTKEEVVES